MSKELRTNHSSKQDTFKVLHKKGYILEKKITDTLQGKIFLAIHKKTQKKVVIKVTSSKLFDKKAAKLQNGKIINNINENIVKEASIMKYLQKKKPPKGIFLKCTNNY